MLPDRTILCGIVLMVAAVAGCATSGSSPAPGAAGAPSLDEAQAIARAAARADRERFRDMSFEQFEAAVYKEPFEGGKYIVNGDTPIADRKHLQEFFENQVRKSPAPIERHGQAGREPGGWPGHGLERRAEAGTHLLREHSLWAPLQPGRH